MKKLLSALFVLALCTSAAFASTPDATQSTVTPCDALGGAVVCPDVPGAIPASQIVVTVNNSSGNPISNSPVVITLAGTNNCTGIVLTGTTNLSGVFTTTLKAGGCNPAFNACQVTASGIPLRSFDIKSPDWDGAAGSKIVDVGDFVPFVAEYTGSAPAGCFDFNHDPDVIGDFVIFAGAYSPSHHCDP
jgi:hypothetical protein